MYSLRAALKNKNVHLFMKYRIDIPCIIIPSQNVKLKMVLTAEGVFTYFCLPESDLNPVLYL